MIPPKKLMIEFVNAAPKKPKWINEKTSENAIKESQSPFLSFFHNLKSPIMSNVTARAPNRHKELCKVNNPIVSDVRDSNFSILRERRAKYSSDCEATFSFSIPNPMNMSPIDSKAIFLKFRIKDIFLHYTQRACI